MNDQDKNDFKADIDAIRKELGEVRKALTRIERRQAKDRKNNLRQSAFGIGFAGMTAGMGLAVAKIEYAQWGLLLFFFGVLITMIPSMITPKSKQQNKNDKSLHN